MGLSHLQHLLLRLAMEDLGTAGGSYLRMGMLTEVILEAMGEILLMGAGIDKHNLETVGSMATMGESIRYLEMMMAT